MRKRKGSVKTIPAFATEAEEAAFWDRIDSTSYFPAKGNIHIKMPPRNVTISLRLPKRLLERLRRIAGMKDVPYQSLLKIFLDEKVREEIAELKKVA
jgi:predicted DNA binding CopG/RHH family protein